MARTKVASARTKKKTTGDDDIDRLRLDSDIECGLSKAKALAAVLGQLGERGGPIGISNNLVNALNDDSYPDETLEWLRDVVDEALRDALEEIEEAFSKRRRREQAPASVTAQCANVVPMPAKD